MIPFQKKFTIRLFSVQNAKIARIVRWARDEDNFRKYKDESHFIRSAIETLIRKEELLINVGGRPPIYDDGSGKNIIKISIKNRQKD